MELRNSKCVLLFLLLHIVLALWFHSKFKEKDVPHSHSPKKGMLIVHQAKNIKLAPQKHHITVKLCEVIHLQGTWKLLTKCKSELKKNKSINSKNHITSLPELCCLNKTCLLRNAKKSQFLSHYAGHFCLVFFAF